MSAVAATLKVEDATKKVLDRLQATLTLALGRKPTLQEIVDRLAQRGWLERDALMRDFQGQTRRRATEEDLRRRKEVVAALARRPPSKLQMNPEDIEIYEESWRS